MKMLLNESPMLVRPPPGCRLPFGITMVFTGTPNCMKRKPGPSTRTSREAEKLSSQLPPQKAEVEKTGSRKRKS
ncbi:unnamed protein product [Schistocephalus solidus]|uniref:Uncharacterized protein n=1 Tax=Schistocephalus solidus TaxID=70667 RepID=A0A183SFB5_SCHSO|nr:unnamed protein product [Schistocephalus solidus]